MSVLFKRIQYTECELHEGNYWENLGYDWMTLEDYLKNCYLSEVNNSCWTETCQYLASLVEAMEQGVVVIKMDFDKEFVENYKKLDALRNKDEDQSACQSTSNQG